MIASRRFELCVVLSKGMRVQASFRTSRCAKMEVTSRTSGGNLRLLYGGIPPFVKVKCSNRSGDANVRNRDPDRNAAAGRERAPPPDAGGCAPQLRQARRPRPAPSSPRRAPRRRSRTSPSAPASGSGRSTGTSRRARRCSRPSTSRRSRRWPARPTSSSALPPWDALSQWLHRYVGFAATKRALNEALTRGGAGLRRAAHVPHRDPTAGDGLVERAQRRASFAPTRTSWTSSRLVGGIADGSDGGSRAEGADARARARRPPLPAAGRLARRLSRSPGLPGPAREPPPPYRCSSGARPTWRSPSRRAGAARIAERDPTAARSAERYRAGARGSRPG